MNLYNKILKLEEIERPMIMILLGRSISKFGSGFTVAYMFLFFVNEVGITTTSVGLGLGLGSITGILGRSMGLIIDPQATKVENRHLVLCSIFLSIISSGFFFLSNGLLSFLIGCIISGFAIGLYWPSMDGYIADITTKEQRLSAYATSRVSDSSGLMLGTFLGSISATMFSTYRGNFFIEALCYLIFFSLLFFTQDVNVNAEQPDSKTSYVSMAKNTLSQIIGDKIFLFFLIINTIFITFISASAASLAQYLSEDQFALTTIGFLVSLRLFFETVLQIPIVRQIKRGHVLRGLSVSALFWSISFFLIFLTLITDGNDLILMLASIFLTAVAIVSYHPTASSFVSIISPEKFRSTYISINSLCWSLGYFLAPTIAGWALTTSNPSFFWLGLTIVAVIQILIMEIFLKLLNLNKG